MGRAAGLVFLFVLASCDGGGQAPIPPPTMAPLHDVYEATNVTLPDGSGNGTLAFALSQEGSGASNLAGEVVLLKPGNMNRLILQDGAVTQNGSTAMISGQALDSYTNRVYALSGTATSLGITYSLSGEVSANGQGVHVAPYVDPGQTFVSPAGFLGTHTYAAANTACANGTVYVAIGGAQPDGHGLWLPQGAVGISSPPNISNPSSNDGVWDGSRVLAVTNLGGSVLAPSPTLEVTLSAFPSAGSNGGLAQFGGSPCVSTLSP